MLKVYAQNDPPCMIGKSPCTYFTQGGLSNPIKYSISIHEKRKFPKQVKNLYRTFVYFVV